MKGSRIILWDECPASDGNGAIDLSRSGSREVYQRPEDLLSQDELLTFPWAFKYVFGKRVIPGRA